MDKVHKFYTKDLKIRIAVAKTTEVVRHMCDLQETFPLASVGLGRLLTGTLLMASQLREGQRIGIQIKGDGPLGFLFAEADFEGQTRGYCGNGQLDLPATKGKLDLASAVGKGLVTVTRSQPFQKEPHHGIVPIQTGEISQDLAFYMYQSHQVPSVISLAVHLDKNAQVAAAGGVFLEVLPGVEEKVIRELEEKSQKAPSLSQKLLQDAEPIQLARMYSHSDELVPVEHPYEIKYTCKCSKERVTRTFSLLGRSTLAEMILKGEDVAATCQFCGRSFKVAPDEMRHLLEEE